MLNARGWVMAGLILALLSIEAQARCYIVPGTFSFGQNAEATAAADSQGCPHTYTVNKYTTFSSATIAANPRNGVLKQEGPINFHYTPNPGFKGQESYSIRVCGEANRQKGCSTITYHVKVE